MMICPGGHGQRAGKFCGECGAELVPVPENPNKLFEIHGMQKCPACDYKLGHEHQKFCPGCGHQLEWTCRSIDP